MPDLAECLWRVGRKVGRTIYAQPNNQLDEDGFLIGMMDTPDLAEAAVIAHNVSLGFGRVS